MVRLKARTAAHWQSFEAGFNSLMVRLKADAKEVGIILYLVFQFLDGAIKRVTGIPQLNV